MHQWIFAELKDIDGERVLHYSEQGDGRYYDNTESAHESVPKSEKEKPHDTAKETAALVESGARLKAADTVKIAAVRDELQKVSFGKPKDARELLGQFNGRWPLIRKETQEIIDAAGYDDDEVTALLQKRAEENPAGYRYFLKGLRRDIKEEHQKVTDTFSNFDAEHAETEDYAERVVFIQQITLEVGKDAPEMAKRRIHDMFQSGNYLVHGTSVEGALAVVSDGALMSVAAKREGDPKFKSWGGYSGISFSYDGVGALPGTNRHMVAFLTSPEAALDQDSKLTVPYLAATNEVQIVEKTYDKVEVAQRTRDFQFLIDGRLEQAGDLRMSLKSGSGKSEIEKNIQKLHLGEISVEDIRNMYSFDETSFHVSPALSDVGISDGIVWGDYALQHTEKGKAIEKQLNELTPQEMLTLLNETDEDAKKFFPGLRKANSELAKAGNISIPLESLVMLIPSSDRAYWVDMLARTDTLPQAVIVYDEVDGIRRPNWKGPEGHNKRAQSVIEQQLKACDVPDPSLPFPSLFSDADKAAQTSGKEIKYIAWDSVKDAKDITYDATNKQLVTSTP